MNRFSGILNASGMRHTTSKKVDDKTNRWNKEQFDCFNRQKCVRDPGKSIASLVIVDVTMPKYLASVLSQPSRATDRSNNKLCRLPKRRLARSENKTIFPSLTFVKATVG